ncbi:MAG: hypothetical protein ISS46_00530 [Candidatus Omnitrophica bacterium]|nr:hypothetical protein [Candidatus Omnitrophota bacterium]
MKRKRLGFTLLELIMVVVIVIIAGIIVGPRLVNFLTAWDLEAEAKKLRARIMDARQLAITKQKTYRLEFDLDSESYDVEYDPGDGSYILVETVSLKNSVDLYSTEFTNNKVDFDYIGAPSQAGNIVLIDTRGDTSTVSIASATGRVKIQ